MILSNNWKKSWKRFNLPENSTANKIEILLFFMLADEDEHFNWSNKNLKSKQSLIRCFLFVQFRFFTDKKGWNSTWFIPEIKLLSINTRIGEFLPLLYKFTLVLCIPSKNIDPVGYPIAALAAKPKRSPMRWSLFLSDRHNRAMSQTDPMKKIVKHIVQLKCGKQNCYFCLYDWLS